MSRYPDAQDVAEQLAGRAEAVCRTYLPKGQKAGNYWMVGDATGAPGRSMYVRLRGPLAGKGAAGKWSDAATGDHGNLLDLIRHARGLTEFRDVMAEACRFLSLPDPCPRVKDVRHFAKSTAAAGRDYASRLFTSSRALMGSVAEVYLRRRGIEPQTDFGALRFHPRGFHSTGDDGRPILLPTLVAAVTDLDGALTGVSRTFLARDGAGKADVDPPRRAKGYILGNGVRFGAASDVLAVGEGIETTLSLRAAMPGVPLAAATGSGHLSALAFPLSLRTLLVIRDNDHAGDAAADALFTRGRAAGIDVYLIEPECDDLNTDLTRLGRGRMIHRVRQQVPPALVERFMTAG